MEQAPDEPRTATMAEIHPWSSSRTREQPASESACGGGQRMVSLQVSKGIAGHGGGGSRRDGDEAEGV
ncbi:hypothetical protein BAUCODRAFT_35302 [Baudoinia panamericana UAMH 10762]|uniref:Uncharacterized protein n=1 Tax=Baudoinia panamericana (strain UAMH 10762) TaxID=717646 RepID=M2LLX3_BAUPA|nr:uncharacterized protein BAUCODRAFT_35302 [Baudoinia panamericana UAMH 10762]EMC95317.1 hypothetical protein BAUCODRAFT_35302 [Baudoinia panamericana UAMH 10762]